MRLARVALAFAFSATVLAAQSGDAAEAVRQAETRWQAARILGYEFTLELRVFARLPAVPPTFRVVGTDGTSKSPILTSSSIYDRYNTVDKLFALLRNTAASNPRRMNVTFDPVLGYPVTADLDPELIPDDEVSFRVSGFRVLEPGERAFCAASPTRQARTIRGEVDGGASFADGAGPFELRLRASDGGWGIHVFERGGDVDLAKYTLPLHGPNPTVLLASYFRNADNTGPNDGSVNAPGAHREFVFSPEVDRSIRYDAEAVRMLAAVGRIQSFGRGTLDVVDSRITPPEKGAVPKFLWIKFEACLSWPR